MIDYENIRNANVSNIPADTHIWLFIGASQSAPSIEHFDFLFQRFGVERVHIIKIYWAAPNALDFCLSYHLGKIIQSDEQAQVWILSRDQGFNVLVKQVCMEERNNKVATAINLADVIEKMNHASQNINPTATESAQTLPENTSTPIQAAETPTPTPTTNDPHQSNANDIVVVLSPDQLSRQYMSRVFTLLREASANNMLTFQRRITLETNLARHFKQKIWADSPEIMCHDDDLQKYIHQAISRAIERGFIVENDNGTLQYLLQKEDFLAHAKRHYFANQETLPKTTAGVLGQLKTIANMWNLTPLDATAQTWFEQFQAAQWLWICGNSVSYVSENHARDMELKSRFLSNLDRDLGKTFSPNTQSALKNGIRKKADAALVSISEEEIYKLVANLIKTKRVFVNGDDLMWANTPTNTTPNYVNPNKTYPKKPYTKKPYENQTMRNPWERILNMITSPNRPTSLITMRAHLINSLSSLNQTENDIDRWIQKLVNEGYIHIDGESGRVHYR